jgi:hypothetical protein
MVCSLLIATTGASVADLRDGKEEKKTGTQRNYHVDSLRQDTISFDVGCFSCVLRYKNRICVGSGRPNLK